MADNYKEVYFGKWCGHCKYENLPEIMDIYEKGVLVDKRKTICFDCMEEAARLGSHIPVKFEEA